MASVVKGEFKVSGFFRMDFFCAEAAAQLSPDQLTYDMTDPAMLNVHNKVNVHSDDGVPFDSNWTPRVKFRNAVTRNQGEEVFSNAISLPATLSTPVVRTGALLTQVQCKAWMDLRQFPFDVHDCTLFLTMVCGSENYHRDGIGHDQFWIPIGACLKV